ncbi:uncharacterized protein PV09_05393 [Verruconis gallopava]|uniref:PLD phosphodiesterase domain-containing protein n=1 Tax=Verruconis gallopava TaxID=253628 RepID=A0A0D2AAN6_9PEZI|nr:uncharacterized protein PV09_05393 [Verruconis gallopava]KIW03645.1 hypothetical protein PV09_05393 [Verruconis gallopava]
MASILTDEDNEDLQRAIAMSLESNQKAMATAQDHETNSNAGPTTSSRFNAFLRNLTMSNHEHLTSTKQTGSMSFDRKALEQERLARAASRRRQKSISPPPRKRARVEDPNTRTELPAILSTFHQKISGGAVASSAMHCALPSGLRFPFGTIKKTWSARHTSDERTIKIEDIIDKNNVHTAVLSSFMIDPDWILSTKFNTRRTKFYMILHAKTQAEKAMLRDDFDGLDQARLCMPKLTGMIGCQHSKLMLLFFSGFLRVVIPSANLTDYDWGETGFMENSVFLIDLPRRRDGSEASLETLPSFAQSLLRFLKNQDVTQDVRDGILNFDFSKTERLAFVHTSAGSHFNMNMHSTGLPGLSAAVRELGLETDEDIQVDFAASSIGNLNYQTINCIYEAARGKDITTTASSERIKNQNAKIKANMRIYFPTHDTVRESLGGPENAGTICLDSSFWKSAHFPRDIFRDYQSTRKGLLSHNKILLVRGKKSDGSPIAWAYIGSANCSDSAWGRMVAKEAKINCNNWESGVLVPVENPPQDLTDLTRTFESILDVPFVYGEGKGLEYSGKKPWFFKEHRF